MISGRSYSRSPIDACNIGQVIAKYLLFRLPSSNCLKYDNVMILFVPEDYNTAWIWTIHIINITVSIPSDYTIGINQIY